MKKIILLIGIIMSYFISYSQLTVKNVKAGQYALRTITTNDYETHFTSNGKVTYDASVTSVTVVDTVFYIPASAPNDTIATLMTAAANHGIAGILFERGSERNTTITVSNDSLVFGSYGSGILPKIYGSEIITGWTLHSGNIWKATFTTDITQLFVDGEKMQVARLTNSGYNTITGITSQTQFTCSGISGAIDYTGARVILRTEDWYSITRTVTSSSSNTLTINSAPSGTIAVGKSVLILNKLDFLDSPGEWHYDTATNTVYVWMPDGDSPDGYEVRGSTISNGIQWDDKNYITIQNLDILQQKDRGIEIYGYSSNITIQNCNFSGQDNYAIYTETDDVATNHNYINNNISDINGIGLYAYRIGASTFSNNTISNIGLFNNWGIGDNHGEGLHISKAEATGTNIISYNKISNTGYNTIYWTGTANINHNHVYNIGLAKSDGAGIYTGGTTANGSVVSYNIIENSVGEKLGGITTRNIGEGIYLDEPSVGITAEYNTILNCTNGGIFIHDSDAHTIRYNKVIGARYGMYVTEYTGSTPANINNNTFITNSAINDYEPRQLAVRFNKGLDANVNVIADYNTYINPFSSDLIFRLITGNYKNFQDWKDSTGVDANSTYIGTDFSANETQRLVYNNTTTPKTFYLNNATSVKDSVGISITGSFVLQPFTSKYVRGLNLDCILDYSDSTAPTITAFTIPETGESVEIPISIFTATGATAYLITESETTPTLLTAGWSELFPTTYTVSGSGSITLYAWVRDAAGNISSYVSDDITITLPDYTATLTNGLLVAYDFEETSGLLQDVSGNGRNATTQGANITINQAGNPGKSYLFAGTTFSDARISVADNDLLSFTDSMSIIFWVKLTTINKAHALVYKGTGTGPAYEYMVKITSGNKIQYNIFQNGTSTNMQAVGSTELAADTWYMIECSATNILDRSTMKISVNKVDETLTLSGNSTITNVVNGSGLYYIAGESFVGSWLNGNISQLLMHDRVLTTEEKIGLYNSGTGINVADW